MAKYLKNFTVDYEHDAVHPSTPTDTVSGVSAGQLLLDRYCQSVTLVSSKTHRHSIREAGRV